MSKSEKPKVDDLTKAEVEAIDATYNSLERIKDVLFFHYANLTVAEMVIDDIANDNKRGYASDSQWIENLRRWQYRRYYIGERGPRSLALELKTRQELDVNSRCYYCYAEYDGTTKPTREHFLVTRSRMKEIKAENAITADQLKAAEKMLEGSDNAILVCRSCNSSRGNKDFVRWWQQQPRNKGEKFPPLFLIRTYLKLQVEWCRDIMQVMDCRVDEVDNLGAKAPFEICALPLGEFPPFTQEWKRPEFPPTEDVDG